MDWENMDKATILKMVREGWETFAEVVGQFDDAQMVEAHPPEGWRVQDVMVHVSHWESHALERLQEASRGENPRLAPDLDQEQLDQENRKLLEAGRKRSLDDVKAAFQRVHAALVAEIEKIPEARDDPWWGVWPRLDMPWRVIIGETSNHYADHLDELKRWLE